MLSLGIDWPLAPSMAVRSRGLRSGSLPPSRAAMEISCEKRLNILPFLASTRALMCFTFDHLLCPAMRENLE